MESHMADLPSSHSKQLSTNYTLVVFPIWCLSLLVIFIVK